MNILWCGILLIFNLLAIDVRVAYSNSMVIGNCLAGAPIFYNDILVVRNAVVVPNRPWYKKVYGWFTPAQPEINNNSILNVSRIFPPYNVSVGHHKIELVYAINKIKSFRIHASIVQSRVLKWKVLVNLEKMELFV